MGDEDGAVALAGACAAAGMRLQHLAETDSTNRVAMDAARSGAPQGLVVVADHQTGGRGRQGRSWQSHGRSTLTFSLLRRPAVPPGEAWRWTLLAGLAAADEANAQQGESAVAAVWLKWPNDVLRGHRKLCGVLCELSLVPTLGIVVGVGLNLAAPAAGWPNELSPTATSIREGAARGGPGRSPAATLAGLLRRFVALELDLLQPGGPARLHGRAQAAMAPMFGRRVRAVLGDGELHGTATGLAPDGPLQLRDDAGMLHDLRAADVHLEWD